MFSEGKIIMADLNGIKQQLDGLTLLEAAELVKIGRAHV